MQIDFTSVRSRYPEAVAAIEQWIQENPTREYVMYYDLLIKYWSADMKLVGQINLVLLDLLLTNKLDVKYRLQQPDGSFGEELSDAELMTLDKTNLHYERHRQAYTSYRPRT